MRSRASTFPPADGDGQFLFIFRGEQLGLVDLAEIRFQRGLRSKVMRAASCLVHERW